MIFSCKKGFLFFTKIVIVLLTVKEISGIDQKISFFTSEDCNGKNVSFGDPSTTFTPEVKTSKSFLVEYGAWKVIETSSGSGSGTQNENKENSTTTGRNENDDKSKATIWSANQEYKICRSKALNFVEIQRVGERDLDSDTLTLYPNLDFMGAPTVVNDSKSFGNGIEIKSWAITGVKGWAAYKEKDYQGDVTCFEASSAQYGVATFSGDQKGLFFSIQKGCSGSSSLKSFFKLLFSSVTFHIFLRCI